MLERHCSEEGIAVGKALQWGRHCSGEGIAVGRHSSGEDRNIFRFNSTILVTPN